MARLSWLLLAVAFAFGCGRSIAFIDDAGVDDSATDTVTAGDGDDRPNPGTSAGPVTTGQQTVTDSETRGPVTSSSTVTTDATATSTSTTGTSTSTGTSTGAPGLPDGSPCVDGGECMSGVCFVVPVLGGVCGECDDDGDCPGGGCTVPNPLAGQGSECNMGELGGGCETDAACMPGLECAGILNVPGIIDVSTCSECDSDFDCVGGLCSPDYDVPNLTGARLCVPPGSVPLGGGCDLGIGGNAECQSGRCVAADIMGLATLGVCSECRFDFECPAGQSCSPPLVDLQAGLIPGTCN